MLPQDLVHPETFRRSACVVVGGKYAGVAPLNTREPTVPAKVTGPVTVAVTAIPPGISPRATWPNTVQMDGYSGPAEATAGSPAGAAGRAAAAPAVTAPSAVAAR